MFQKILQSIIWIKHTKGRVTFFSDYRSINTNEVSDFHKYLMKELLQNNVFLGNNK